MRKVCGVGICDVIGSDTKCPIYDRWKTMLRRCYSEKFIARNPTYTDCTVCDEWLTFSNFKQWMEAQDWKGKDLDKDLLVQGNKVYSPSTCMFVSHDINSLTTASKATRGAYPIGVSFHSRSKKYQVKLRVGGKSSHIGHYNTPEEAHEAYKAAKEAHVHKIALEQPEPLRSALLRWRVEQ